MSDIVIVTDTATVEDTHTSWVLLLEDLFLMLFLTVSDDYIAYDLPGCQVVAHETSKLKHQN